MDFDPRTGTAYGYVMNGMLSDPAEDLAVYTQCEYTFESVTGTGGHVFDPFQFATVDTHKRMLEFARMLNLGKVETENTMGMDWSAPMRGFRITSPEGRVSGIHNSGLVAASIFRSGAEWAARELRDEVRRAFLR